MLGPSICMHIMLLACSCFDSISKSIHHNIIIPRYEQLIKLRNEKHMTHNAKFNIDKVAKCI